jgi:hypothetical protein
MLPEEKPLFVVVQAAIPVSRIVAEKLSETPMQTL